jgi:site-specific recombinase XerD
MRTGHYTRLKGRVTYFRRKIPELLQERLASTEICYRLGVISSRLAERLGRRLAVEVDDFFERATIDPMLNSADLTKLVQTAIAAWRADDSVEAARDIQSYGRPFLHPKEQATAWAELALGLIRQVGDGESAYGPAFVSEMAKAAGVAAGDDQVVLAAGGRALSLGLAAHYLQSAVATATMHGLGGGRKGLPVHEWQERLAALQTHLGFDGNRLIAPNAHQASGVAAAEQAGTAPSSALSLPAGEPDKETKPFSELVAECLSTRIANKEIKADLRQEMRSSLRIWTEAVGDRPITSYRRADFLRFRAVLQQVPKIYWKSAASRALSILEVIEWARADARADWLKTAPAEKRTDPAAIEQAASNYVRVSNTTINRHLSTISPVFDWALDNHYLAENVRKFWDSLHLPTGFRVTGLKPNEERPAYTHEQIRIIAQHPVWLGRKSAYFYNAPGDVIIRDSLYWGFPIVLLHGMRREEFAQLLVRHIRKIEGIWVFDLHAHDVSVKKAASRRYVPIHSQLLALGFIEAMVEGRRPDERLFDDLSTDGVVDKFGDELGKRFGRVLDHLGIVVIRKNGTESDGCFHPLRHRFVTDLLKVGVRASLVDSLSGHASKARSEHASEAHEGERLRYEEDSSVSELKEAIERLPVSVDFGPWVDAWQRLGNRRVTAR